MNRNVNGTTVPLMKLGTDVATVARKFVPNCSAAIVTNSAQYPIPNPRAKQVKKKKPVSFEGEKR